jgi:hypothetical protein
VSAVTHQQKLLAAKRDLLEQAALEYGRTRTEDAKESALTAMVEYQRAYDAAHYQESRR